MVTSVPDSRGATSEAESPLPCQVGYALDILLVPILQLHSIPSAGALPMGISVGVLN